MCVCVHRGSVVSSSSVLQLYIYRHTKMSTVLHTLYLSEADASVIILIHSFDHLLQSEVGLGLPEFLHHQLQFHEVNEVVAIHIIPGSVCV